MGALQAALQHLGAIGNVLQVVITSRYHRIRLSSIVKLTLWEILCSYSLRHAV